MLERQSRDGRPGTVVQSSAFSKFDAVHNAGFENDHFIRIGRIIRGNNNGIDNFCRMDDGVVSVQKDIIAGVRDIGGNRHADFVSLVQVQRVARDIIVQNIILDG